MKKIILFITLLVSSVMFSQMYNPVKWTTVVEKISGDEYLLVTTGHIEKGKLEDGKWAVYGQGKRKNKGPVPTSFKFEPNDNYELIGENEEFNVVEKFDETFKMKVKKFYGKAIFKQKIKLKAESAIIHAQVNFMVCNNVRCLPPEPVDIVFFAPQSSKAKNEKLAKKKEKAVDDETANKLLYGMTADELIPYKGADAEKSDEKKSEAKEDVASSEEKKKKSKSLLTIFFLAFLGGFAALLTPCVFPMIPMTVSYFTKQSKTRAAGIKNAIFYGISIIFIYVFLGVVITNIAGPEALNAMSSNVKFNLFFFILLVVFAISFLGYFEITLPSSWSTKIDSQADRGGYLGIFFMALALAVVSFSCTGPIVGGLLVESVSKGALAPAVGMFGFSLAIALPFALFAAFPGWLNSLPQSGGWMNTVKVVLGFLELALAFKFLSVADLKGEWGILRYEVFIVIWIILFFALALYLFGKIKFPHDGPIKKLSLPRKLLGFASLAFAIYLCFGFRYDEVTKTYKPLTLLSGLAPSAGYSYLYPNDCPNNLPCFHDLKKGLAYAKEQKKAIMLDFTGYSCVNCRKMEDHVWSIKKIDSVIRNKYVLISLHVDDSEHELPKKEQIIVNSVTGSTKKLMTYADKWSHLQSKFFKTNSQPYYILMGYQEEDFFGDKMYILKELNKHAAYNPNNEEYYNWLVKGTQEFEKLSKNDESESESSEE